MTAVGDSKWLEFKKKLREDKCTSSVSARVAAASMVNEGRRRTGRASFTVKDIVGWEAEEKDGRKRSTGRRRGSLPSIFKNIKKAGEDKKMQSTTNPFSYLKKKFKDNIPFGYGDKDDLERLNDLETTKFGLHMSGADGLSVCSGRSGVSNRSIRSRDSSNHRGACSRSMTSSRHSMSSHDSHYSEDEGAFNLAACTYAGGASDEFVAPRKEKNRRRSTDTGKSSAKGRRRSLTKSPVRRTSLSKAAIQTLIHDEDESDNNLLVDFPSTH